MISPAEYNILAADLQERLSELTNYINWVVYKHPYAPAGPDTLSVAAALNLPGQQKFHYARDVQIAHYTGRKDMWARSTARDCCDTFARALYRPANDSSL